MAPVITKLQPSHLETPISGGSSAPSITATSSISQSMRSLWKISPTMKAAMPPRARILFVRLATRIATTSTSCIERCRRKREAPRKRAPCTVDIRCRKKPVRVKATMSSSGIRTPKTSTTRKARSDTTSPYLKKAPRSAPRHCQPVMFIRDAWSAMAAATGAGSTAMSGKLRPVMVIATKIVRAMRLRRTVQSSGGMWRPCTFDGGVLRKNVEATLDTQNMT
mmetsp:Transcript_18354/g.53345  ORF Transcript_18354/g.53345 Transcript_18354/m.53345 type:complete len:222 (-) Transcript_18354:751-1416(-)